MSDLLKRRISRRNMIKGTAAAGASIALAACQPKVVEKIVEKEVTTVVEKVVEKEVVKEVESTSGELSLHFITQLWAWQKLNMATATDQYNINNRGKVRVEVDPAPDGWDTKVVQMIKDGELAWDGHGRTRNLGEIRDYNRLGILQPWDDFINSSSVPWASQFWDQLLPNIRESFSQDGKLYGLPWDIEAFCRVYRKDLWEELGETPAETLSDFEMQLQEMKKIFPDKVPFGFNHWTTHPSEQMWIQLYLQGDDTGWVYEDGLGSMFDVRGDAYKEVLVMWKRWNDEGLISKDSASQETWQDNWLKGLTTCVQSNASWTQAQSSKIYGRPNIVPMTNFVLEAGDQPVTFTFANGSMLFKGAKHPQEITDWWLWMLDPTLEKAGNYSMVRGCLNYYHFPCYKGINELLIPTNSDWAWMEPIFSQIEASKTIPTDAHLNIYGPIAKKWHESYLWGNATLDECVNGIYEEERDQTKKFQAGEA